MTAARNRVAAALALFLIGCGATIVAAFYDVHGWLVLAAYLGSAVLSWNLYGALMKLAMIRQQEALQQRAPTLVDQLKRWAAEQPSATPKGTNR